MKPALSSPTRPPGSGSIRFRALSRRKTLKPGVYRLTLRARDAAGNLSSRLRARVDVLPRKR